MDGSSRGRKKNSIVLRDNFFIVFCSLAGGWISSMFFFGKKRKTALRSGDIPGTIPAAGVNDF